MSEPEPRAARETPVPPDRWEPAPEPLCQPCEAAGRPAAGGLFGLLRSARPLLRYLCRALGNTVCDRRRRAAALALLLIVLAAGTQAWRVRSSRTLSQPRGAPSVRPVPARAAPGSEFDFSHLRIPRQAIRSGGPPRDGIPALTRPAVVPAAKATTLRPTDRVVGVVVDGVARAYPLRILTWHELVNDRIGRVPLLVSYCPLCDSAAVFDRRTSAGVREFGVSGLLYNSNVLMYARGQRPFALWSQLLAQAVSGPQSGERLASLPFQLTTWQAWQSAHPRTEVLSFHTGYGRSYGINPYVRYFTQPGLMFPVSPTSRRLPAKSRVLGVWTDNKAIAYPIDVLARHAGPLEQQIGGHRFTIRYDAASNTAQIAAADAGVRWVYAFWFAWYAFHPETDVFSGP